MRYLDKEISEHFKNYNEVLILLGPRQVGKTTLLQRVFPSADYYLVDNEPIRKLLESYDANVYSTIVKPGQILILDESHLLSNPGRMAKIFYDNFPGIRLVLTGSSSFHLKKGTQESLAGRKIDYHLFPLSFDEYLFQNKLEKNLGFQIFESILNKDKKTSIKLYDLKAITGNTLIFGLYPNVINHPQDTLYLKNFVDSIIFKDILGIGLIENQRVARDLLRLLAYQIGKLINYSELATKLGADQRTIKRYIEIFEESFLIYRVYPFLQNPRDEVVKSAKIYFVDVGIRNTILDDFRDIDFRTDAGALFENFIFSEVIKSNAYLKTGYKIQYWRTKQGSEVDLILSRNNEIHAVEIKLNKKRVNTSFLKRYPQASFKTLSIENFY